MRTSKRNANLRRYRNLPMDAVLALLAESRDEEYFLLRDRRRRQTP